MDSSGSQSDLVAQVETNNNEGTSSTFMSSGNNLTSQEQQQQCASTSGDSVSTLANATLTSGGLGAGPLVVSNPDSLVEMQLGKFSDKLAKLIKSSELKKINIRRRLTKGELEPQFLALEHKVVAAEHIRALEDLQTDVEQLKAVAARENEEKNNEFKSQSQVFKEELFKEVVELLETEFSCVVCTEVFVQPSVIDCGHTFCSHCINEWKKEKRECPICRKAIIVCTKHVEMDNFVSKIHTMLSEEIQNRRRDLLTERENAVRISAATQPAVRPAFFATEFGVIHEMNGIFQNARMMNYGVDDHLGFHNVHTFRRRTPPLSPDYNLPSNEPLDALLPTDMSSDDDEDIEGEDFSRSISASPFESGFPNAHSNFPIPPVVTPPTSCAGSMNHVNHNRGRFCPFAPSHTRTTNIQNQNASTGGSSPYPPCYSINGTEVTTNEQRFGYTGHVYGEPLAHLLPQATHTNNYTHSIMRQRQQLDGGCPPPPPAHQRSSSNGFFSLRQPQLSQPSSSHMPPNVNVTFRVGNPNRPHYGFAPMISPSSRDLLYTPALSIPIPMPAGLFSEVQYFPSHHHPVYGYSNQLQRPPPLFTATSHPVGLPDNSRQRDAQMPRTFPTFPPDVIGNTNNVANNSSSEDTYGLMENYTNTDNRRLGRRRRLQSEPENNNLQQFDEEDEVEIIDEIHQEESSESWEFPPTDNINYGEGRSHTTTFANDMYDASNFNDDTYPHPPRRRRTNNHRASPCHVEGHLSIPLVNSPSTRRHSHRQRRGQYNVPESGEF